MDKLVKFICKNEEMLRQYCGKNADNAKRYKLLDERIAQRI